MSPATRVAALTLQAAQRSALLAHVSSATSSHGFSSSATPSTSTTSTSSLSSAIYLSASNSLRSRAAGVAKQDYEEEDASAASYMAFKAGRVPVKKAISVDAADSHFPESDAELKEISVASKLNV